LSEEIYPLTFTPALRHYMWGGRRLETLYGRALPPGIVAESWEISGHSTAATPSDSGYWAGQPLPHILAELGERLVGTRAGWALSRGRFPLLVKLLDAHHDLSVQVHPDDAYALEHEGGELGKTEMWYVLHADPGTELILGVQPGTTREAFRKALESGQLADVLRRIPIAAGDAIAVPAGTVHALLAGAVVTEIQQNSDATYRVYDWGRVDAYGKPRPLHVEKALNVIDYEAAPDVVKPRLLAAQAGLTHSELVRNRYFVVERVALAPGAVFGGYCDGGTLEIWGCMAGQVSIRWAGKPVTLPAVRYVLLPAVLGEFQVAAEASSVCLRIYLPEDA
jgi:mannose-6-phosphate isomerase